MSRLGKLPVEKPDNVDVKVKDGMILVEGPKGSLETKLLPNIEIEVNDKEVLVKRKNDNKKSREAHGLIRMLINNMVIGVSKGYEKKIEIVGVGYRAAQEGKQVKLQLGFSHPVVVEPPEGIEYKVEGTNIIAVSGIDKGKVGQAAADLRKLKEPECYKGKGIRYHGEQIKMKPGKTAAGAGA